MNVRVWLIFALGAASGSAATLLIAPQNTRVAQAATAPPAEPAAVIEMMGLPQADTVEVDEGGAKYTCTAASAEMLDPASSSPRLLISADCPNGKRLLLTAHPMKLPGTPRVDVIRFADSATGEEWASSDASMNVASAGQVGDDVDGRFEATMLPRLNREAVHVSATFRARRAKDRFSP